MKSKFIEGLIFWNQINKYHTSRTAPYTIFGFDGLINDFEGVGFELEFDTLRPKSSNEFREKLAEILIKNNTKNEYFIEHDSSLRYGCELITQPHTIESLREFLNSDMKHILEEVKNNTEVVNHANNSALHIHISKNVFGATTEEQQENVSKLWYLFSSEREAIKKISNRHIFRKCPIPIEPLDPISARELVSKHWNSTNRRDRYFAINCRNEPTIEIRIIASTTDIEELKTLIEFYWFLANKTKEMSWKNANDLKAWIKDLSEPIKIYIQQQIDKK